MAKSASTTSSILFRSRRTGKARKSLLWISNSGIRLLSIVTSGAGPRAVGTERGRWSKWWWTTPAPLTGLESHEGVSEGLKEEWWQWKTREDQAWILVCVLCAAVVFYFVFGYFFIKVLNVCRFPPPFSRIYITSIINQSFVQANKGIKWHSTIKLKE